MAASTELLDESTTQHDDIYGQAGSWTRLTAAKTACK